MKRRAKNNNSFGYILRTGAIVLFICVLVSLLHVLDIRYIYRKQANTSLNNMYASCLDNVNDEVNQIEEQIDRYEEKIVNTAADREVLVKFLYEASNENEGYKAYYVYNSSYVYGPEGVFYNDSFYKSLIKFPVSRYSNGYLCTYGSEFDFIEDKDCIIGVKKIESVDGPAYLVLYKPTSSIIDKNLYNYICSKGALVLCDVSGTVIDNADNSSISINNGESIFEKLVELSNGYSTSANTIDSVRVKMSAENYGSFTFKGSAGYNLYVTYTKVENVKGLYLFAIYNEKVIDDLIAPGVIRSVIACLFLTITLMIVMLVMFEYMQESRNTVIKLAYIDDITGGYNYNYFKTKSVDIIKNNSEIHFIMCRFDIFNFRYINEAYGHKKADMVLTACYEKFNEVFGNKELCVRVNSDQFVALLINDVETSHKYQKYNRIVEEAAKEIGVKFPIRFKTGFYQVHKEDRDVDVMIDHANAARKSVDINKKVVEAVYSDEIITNMKKVDFIESQMNASLNKGEFRVFLQPKWDIINDKVMGAEALVRWVKEDGTIISPGDFIPVFETNGFIEKLDFYMLERVCEMLGKLEKDSDKRALPVSVNQSRILINNPDYIKNVEKVLGRYEIDRKNIQLEITETVFFDEKDKMIEVVNKLKEFGLTLDMDDFGSGYSSLNILKDISFDVLKIDKEFFSETTASSVSVIILEKIIDMATALGIDVICEGVETSEQVELLKSVGCKAVQGYFYGRPMPMDEFIDKYCVINNEH